MKKLKKILCVCMVGAVALSLPIINPAPNNCAYASSYQKYPKGVLLGFAESKTATYKYSLNSFPATEVRNYKGINYTYDRSSSVTYTQNGRYITSSVYYRIR